MMRSVRLLIFILICIHFQHCRDACKETTIVELKIINARNTRLYLVKRGYFKEKDQVIDSAVVPHKGEPVVFQLRGEKDRLYFIKVKESGRRFDFIADVPAVRIKANNLSGQYEIQGSAASESLKGFTSRLAGNAMALRQLQKKIDSLQQHHPASMLLDSLRKETGNLFTLRNQSCISYADTVKNPAAFMAVYNLIEFGRDHKALKQMIEHNAARFPNSNAIQELRQQVIDMIDILEKELNKGDTMPVLRLPDNQGGIFSTATLKGKYYLIDFWATWCYNCIIYNKIKKEALKQFPAGKFTIVSVAIDDNESDWKKQIQAHQQDWVQLIDKDMWTGVAARTMKFDSIPFNFLVSPDGKILAKGVSADSLLTVLRQQINL